MATRVEAALVITDPAGKSAWFDSGQAYSWTSAITATTSLALIPIQIVPTPDTQLAGGLPVTFGLFPGTPLQRLNGALINLETLLAAANTNIIGIEIRRCIDTLGAQIAAAGGAITSIPLTNPLSTPLASGQTFVVTNAAGTAQTWTTSAAVPAGSMAIPVNSGTPSATYVAGTALAFLAGNGPVFGWVGTGSSGTGPPVIPANVSVSLPPITTNIAVVTPGAAGSYVFLFPGDVIGLLLNTTTSTATIPIGCIQTLIA